MILGGIFLKVSSKCYWQYHLIRCHQTKWQITQIDDIVIKTSDSITKKDDTVNIKFRMTPRGEFHLLSRVPSFSIHRIIRAQGGEGAIFAVMLNNQSSWHLPLLGRSVERGRSICRRNLSRNFCDFFKQKNTILVLKPTREARANAQQHHSKC